MKNEIMRLSILNWNEDYFNLKHTNEFNYLANRLTELNYLDNEIKEYIQFLKNENVKSLLIITDLNDEIIQILLDLLIEKDRKIKELEYNIRVLQEPK